MRLGRRRDRRVEGTDDGGCSVDTLDTNLGTRRKLRPLGSRAPLTARKLDATVALPHDLGHVAGLANQPIRIARDIVFGALDPALQEGTRSHQQND